MPHGRSVSLDLLENCVSVPEGSPAETDQSRTKMLRALSRAVRGELTPRQRECVMLFYGGGKNEREVAEALGISIPAVCRHLQKSRKRLRQVLGYYLSE